MAGKDDPYGCIQDIEDALGDYVAGHPEWQTQPSGAVVEEIAALIHNFWSASEKGVRLLRRRRPPQPKDEFGPDDIPF